MARCLINPNAAIITLYFKKQTQQIIPLRNQLLRLTRVGKEKVHITLKRGTN